MGKKVYGVNIYGSAITICKACNHFWKIQILDTKSIAYENLSTSESRLNFVKQTLESIFKNNRSKIYIAINGVQQHSFLVPNVSRIKIKHMVQYEASTQIPCSLEEVLYDYQILDISEEIFTLLASIRKEIIDQFCEPFIGLNMQKITCPSFAAYNFLNWKYPHCETMFAIYIAYQHSFIIAKQQGQFFSRFLPSTPQADVPPWDSFLVEILRAIRYMGADYSNRFERCIFFGEEPFLSQFYSYFVSKEHKRNDLFDLIEKMTQPNAQASIAIGLALQGLKKGAIDINLLPPRIGNAPNAIADLIYKC